MIRNYCVGQNQETSGWRYHKTKLNSDMAERNTRHFSEPVIAGGISFEYYKVTWEKFVMMKEKRKRKEGHASYLGRKFGACHM